MISSIFRLISNKINKAIKANIDNFSPLKKHTNKIITLEIKEFLKHKIYLKVEDKCSVTISNKIDSQIDSSAKVYGSLAEYLKLLRGEKYYDLDIKIDGDIDFIEDFYECFSSYKEDIDIVLSDFIGDTPASLLVSNYKNITDKIKNLKNERLKDTTEYLQEEIKLLPTKVELEELYKGINELDMQIDRCQAKLKLLKNNFVQEK